MTPAALRVRFPRDDGFRADLEARVAGYFARTGRSPFGGRALRVKTAAIFAWFAASYGPLLAFGGDSAWLAVGLTLSLALATAGIGFSVMHDANHGAYSPSPAVNRAMGLTLDFIGASSYVWRFKHNVQHHTYANVDGMDADVDSTPFLRLAPSQPVRRHHRWQHLYAWFLYGVLALKWWLVDDALDLARGRIGPHPYARPGRREVALAIAGKAIFLGWAVVVPALVYRSAWVLLYFGLGATALGLVLSTVFQLAHLVPEARFHAATRGEARTMPTGWAEHQVRATADFAPSNRLLGWYVGGLNFQIEHHLFPAISHVHYPALAPLVADACRARGIPRVSRPTLRAAIAAHHRFLRDLGREAPERPSPARG
jgi:linoleoyl-CoA desaturase